MTLDIVFFFFSRIYNIILYQAFGCLSISITNLPTSGIVFLLVMGQNNKGRSKRTEK